MRYLIRLSFLLLAAATAFAGNGILELDSKPGGAEVFVDGKKKGTTPETEGQKLTMELPEGDHEIVIKKEGVGSTTKKVFVGEGVVQPMTLTILPSAYTNPGGMKFVPVPGTQILMCIHETRNKDYAAYAAANSGVDAKWKNVDFKLGDHSWTIKDDKEYPVVNVSWEDANAYCAWLGRKDGKTYRLPTDHEWSCAVGIGDQENAKETPKAKSGKVPGFPWGAGYPPPQNKAGNYRDAAAVKQSKGYFSSTDLGSYDDGWFLTATVMQFPANKLGIFDLGGNVWEWCQDLYSPEDNYRVLRGGSWINNVRVTLASSYRNNGTPADRFFINGFRCVVVVGGASPKSETKTGPVGGGNFLPPQCQEVRLTHTPGPCDKTPCGKWPPASAREKTPRPPAVPHDGTAGVFP